MHPGYHGAPDNHSHGYVARPVARCYAAAEPAAFHDSNAPTSRKKRSEGEPSRWLTRMQSPRRIWSVAIRFDNGWITRRSMARFRWRAPYLKSVPSVNKNSRAHSVTLIANM